MEEIKKFELFNKYSGSNWNFEHTTKYIFDVRDGKPVEVGYFIHYYEDKEIKHVIELPTSYGCPMKCKFCASSFINDVQNLSVNDTFEIFNYIYDKHHLEYKRPLLVSFTGIGDLYFTFDLVENVISLIANMRNDISFTVSSCFWNNTMIKRIENIYTDVTFKSIQITYISYNDRVLQNVIGYYLLRGKNSPTFQEIVNAIFDSKISMFRINYLMLKGINDTKEDFLKFLSIILPIKDKVVVRISKLNITKASTVNNILESPIELMEDLKILLEHNGIKAYLFYAIKNDGMNCGQLLTEKLPNE